MFVGPRDLLHVECLRHNDILHSHIIQSVKKIKKATSGKCSEILVIEVKNEQSC